MIDAGANTNAASSLAVQVNYSGFSVTAMGVIATIIIGIVPIFAAGMAEDLGLPAEAVGVLAAADMLGCTVASLLCLAIQSRVGWRAILYSALLTAMAGNLLSLLANNYPLLLLCRFIAGLGNGYIVALVFISLCHSLHPDRSFGFYTFGQIALQTLLLTTLPGLIASHGIASVYLLLTAASAVSLLLVQKFPDGLRERPANSAPIPWASAARALRPLAGLTLYFLAVAALWSYLEPMGEGFSLDMSEVGSALGLASFIAMLGPLAVIIIDTRIRRIYCLGFGIALHIVSALILVQGNGYIPYLIAASLFAFALNYSFPYQMGILSTYDSDGSVAIFALVIQLACFSLGPLLASALLFGGYSLVVWCCQLLFVLAFFIYSASARRRTVGTAVGET